jgi:hypothetical protein
MKTISLNEVARLLGGKTNRRWINIPGPGHRKRDNSLGVIFDPKAPDGFRLHSLSGDDENVCRAYFKKLLTRVAAGRAVALEASSNRDNRSGRVNWARRIWAESDPLKGSLAHRYLRARGCGSLPEGVSVYALRFHPLCPFGNDRYPALVAAMRDVTTREIVGIHRTAISDDGNGKRPMPDGSSPKKMMGSAIGAAVVLNRNVGTRLGIAEGIETALSAAMIFKMPVWSVLSVSGIKAFPVIHGIESLCVFADNDEAGMSAAEQCGCRYSDAGIDVDVRYPPLAGSDWNDFMLKEMSCVE